MVIADSFGRQTPQQLLLIFLSRFLLRKDKPGRVKYPAMAMQKNGQLSRIT